MEPFTDSRPDHVQSRRSFLILDGRSSVIARRFLEKACVLISVVGCQDSPALEFLEGSCSIGVRPSMVGGSHYSMSQCVLGQFAAKVISLSRRYVGKKSLTSPWPA